MPWPCTRFSVSVSSGVQNLEIFCSVGFVNDLAPSCLEIDRSHGEVQVKVHFRGRLSLRKAIPNSDLRVVLNGGLVNTSMFAMRASRQGCQCHRTAITQHRRKYCNHCLMFWAGYVLWNKIARGIVDCHAFVSDSNGGSTSIIDHNSLLMLQRLYIQAHFFSLSSRVCSRHTRSFTSKMSPQRDYNVHKPELFRDSKVSNVVNRPPSQRSIPYSQTLP